MDESTLIQVGELGPVTSDGWLLVQAWLNIGSRCRNLLSLCRPDLFVALKDMEILNYISSLLILVHDDSFYHFFLAPSVVSIPSYATYLAF